MEAPTPTVPEVRAHNGERRDEVHGDRLVPVAALGLNSPLRALRAQLAELGRGVSITAGKDCGEPGKHVQNLMRLLGMMRLWHLEQLTFKFRQDRLFVMFCLRDEFLTRKNTMEDLPIVAIALNLTGPSKNNTHG